MAIPTTADITGRELDLEVLQTAAQPRELIRLTPTLAVDGVSRRITGLQKLIQRYTLIFFTKKTDVKFDPNQGTSFVSAVVTGAISTREQIVHNFTFANADVIAQLRSEDADPRFGDPAPDDERIAAARLIDFSINRGTATLLMRVNITTLAGDSTVFVLPVK
jgi:hypothetical protein